MTASAGATGGISKEASAHAVDRFRRDSSTSVAVLSTGGLMNLFRMLRRKHGLKSLFGAYTVMSSTVPPYYVHDASVVYLVGNCT
jgi:hypothetical protein